MISAEGHRGRPLICLLIWLRTSNGCGRISALRYTQRLADLAGPSINEYEFQSGCTANYLHPNMGETARRRPTGIRPYGRSWQRPGVTPDHWPVPRWRTRMSWRVPGWAKYGAAAGPRYIVARTSRLYRLQRTRGRPWQSGPPESAHCPGHLSPGRPESHSRLSSPFSGIPTVSVLPQAAGRLADGTASRRDTAGAGGQERRLGPRRGMIDTARIRGRPPRSDLMCHAGRRGHQLPDVSFSIALK
jgi:hypothetical protein